MSITWASLYSRKESKQPLFNQWLHPCRINGTRHLFHHPQLKKLHPKYFLSLKAFAHQHNWVLSEDRRSRLSLSRVSGTRRRWIQVCLLSFSIGSGACLGETNISTNTSETTLTSSLQAMNHDKESAFEAPISETSKLSISTTDKALGYNASWHRTIKDILLSHWHPTEGTPRSTHKDLDSMAAYFSRFPTVRNLFASISTHAWSLKYAERTHETQVYGNRLSVDSITVFFDPRSAAQFKFYKACTDKIPYCVASPADVLLHELIHVQAVSHSPETFIAQGGMSNLMYPLEHERQTIASENMLYKAMTRIDGHPRPLRSEHSGRHVLAACSTCLQ